ncbi:MAG TPA: Fic family protein [candidate division WOR-3 bacterium]|uniref:Fic family protein n=1 Tax=candidate division WOR-3 bacterium TaxID=2052148 RepID=A0A9C9K1D8_UNCW3|nr:Fic family protein [candidate division WOR-3 bacterium]
MNTQRAGRYIKQPSGYRAFIPNPLPPDPPINYDGKLRSLLSQADRALARLDGITTVLPNPQLFVGMYVKKEALLSSQIEGTQASLEGVLKFEANLTPSEDINEIKEVVNYIKALDYGMKRLQRLPISNRLIKEIHKILITGARGRDKTPGEFRRSQNWIGPAGADLNEATFVPPPPEIVPELMSHLENFIHSKNDIPPLIKIALIHSQFETIHPFLDGNGRVGRLLITFYLYWKRILFHPLLYLSFYLKKYRNEYYHRLMEVRLKGEWERWLKFFLAGVIEVSKEASETAKEIIELKEKLIKRLIEKKMASGYAVGLINMLFSMPIITYGDVQSRLGVGSRDTVNKLINKFIDAQILKEISGKKRYRKYLFSDYLEIIKRGTEV